MSYRIKLLLTFAAVALVTNAISLTLLYQLSRSHLFDLYQEKIKAMAATAAAVLDGDLLEQVHTEADGNSPGYRALKNTLRETLQTNQNHDTYLKRLFTVTNAPQDPSVLLVGVDPENSVSQALKIGEVYRTVDAPAMDLNKTLVENRIITDMFGSSLRAHAPVKNRAGKTVGAVVVEADSQRVDSKLRPALTSAIAAILLALGLAIPAAIFISRRASQPLLELSRAMESIGAGHLETRLEVRSEDEFGQVATAVNAMAAGLAERERVKSAFARFVSQQVMDRVLASGTALALSGDRRRVSVLFCDIRGFSTIAERFPPEKVVELLNDYFERMVEIVFRNHGTLDKFLGDGMMVIFGAPEDDPRQEEHALQAALEIQRELLSLSKKWEPQGIQIRVGVGIHTGPAIVGTMGSSRRMEYTAIGDTVNLASRLESATKELGVSILVSEHTYLALRNSYPFRPMGSIQVRGRVEAIGVFAAIDPQAPLSPEQIPVAAA